MRTTREAATNWRYAGLCDSNSNRHLCWLTVKCFQVRMKRMLDQTNKQGEEYVQKMKFKRVILTI